MRQKWSQVFLIDEKAVSRIVSEAGINPGDSVLEIGPGRGILTYRLARVAGKLAAVEIDGELCRKLSAGLQKRENVSIINGDFLEIDLNGLIKGLVQEKKTLKIISNLPYGSATPIIMKILSLPAGLRQFECVFMLQEEVAQRVCAVPGGKEYGNLTVAVQYRAKAEYLFGVPRGAFSPVPEVDSAVVKLTPLKKPAVRAENEEFFFRLVKVAFMHRRKKIHNSVCSLFSLDLSEVRSIIEAAGIAVDLRPENLSMKQFAELADRFYEKGNILAGSRKGK